MSPESAVLALSTVDPSDPERAHGEADDILLGVVPPEVAAAYLRLVERCSWWAGA